MDAKPTNLQQLISYQAGSVVSREVLKKSTGTVTLFAFDKGQGLSEHKTPFDALVYVFDGQAQITVSGVIHEVKAGEMLLMPANQPHSLFALIPFKMMLTMIRSND